MELVAFDTHQFIQTLSQSGMPVEQAEAISNAVRMAYAHGASDLATKADLAAVKTDLKADLASKTELAAFKVEITDKIEAVKTELEHSNKLLEKSMTIRLGSMLFVTVGVMMAFMKYMQA